MNIDTLGKNLYFFTIIDPTHGREIEGENLIRPFVEKGFRTFGFFVFVSEASISEINEHIITKKSTAFQYFLINMTNNLGPDEFRGLLNTRYFEQGEVAAKIIQDFKPKVATTNLSVEDQQNEILDKISREGIASLTVKEKQFLDNLNK